MDQSNDKQEQVQETNENRTSTASAEEAVKPQRSWLSRYGFSLIVLALCVVMGYFILQQQNGNKGEQLEVIQPGVEFSYPDTDGNTVTLSGTNGKARLLYFFFANCPDVCPPTTALMSQVQDELIEDGVFGDKVEFLSVTIDPTKDTTDVLKEYADRFGADPKGWKFLRGDEQATAELAEQYGILVNKDKDGNFGHMNLIVLLDKEGQVRDWISANDYILEGENNLSPNVMAKKIKSLL